MTQTEFIIFAGFFLVVIAMLAIGRTLDLINQNLEEIKNSIKFYGDKR